MATTTLEQIIKTYGKNDYYEMQTGRIFLLSKMQYHLFSDETIVPVEYDGQIVGTIKLKGDYTK